MKCSVILKSLFVWCRRLLSLCNRYHYSEMMRNVLLSNRDVLIKYRKIGCFTIDYKQEECAVCSFTVKKKNLESFSSEAGIKPAFKDHIIIETCNNVGLNMKEYFACVFSKIIECEEDYEKLLPSVVAQ